MRRGEKQWFDGYLRTDNRVNDGEYIALVWYFLFSFVTTVHCILYSKHMDSVSHKHVPSFNKDSKRL